MILKNILAKSGQAAVQPEQAWDMFSGEDATWSANN